MTTDTFLIIIATLLTVGLSYFLSRELYESGYKKGQVDMLNDKQKIFLIEFEDGERIYQKQPKQEEYKDSFKIIK